MSSDIPSPTGAKRKTVTVMDVVCALKGQGRTLYGFGVKLFHLLKAQQKLVLSEMLSEKLLFLFVVSAAHVKRNCIRKALNGLFK